MLPVPAEINVPRPGALLVVGRDPGEQEVEYRRDAEAGKDYPQGRPFVGPSGAMLDKMLAELGLRRKDVNLANVVGFRPPDNEFKRHDPSTVAAGLDALQGLAKRLKPSLILTLGNEASWSLTGGIWPTAGRGVFGAKGIEERRGYFWHGPYGWVLATLHPAGVLRKAVPGHYLLQHDFRRARKWLAGQLPRESLPPFTMLDDRGVQTLLRSSLTAWDVETKWDMSALSMSGYCGDDLVPRIALYPGNYKRAKQLLLSATSKVGHNGAFDLSFMRYHYDLRVQGYDHDTQHMWWALEPELAGKEEASEEGGAATSRQTRKALAFLASVYGFNVPWFKNYPLDTDDADTHVEKLLLVNAADVWVTRQLASSMWTEMRRAGVLGQYQRSMELLPRMVTQHLRGLRIDDTLRRERIETLTIRQATLEEQAHVVGLRYVTEHQLDYFCERKECQCCGGGKVVAQHCWRCGGLPKKPETKADYGAYEGKQTVTQLRGALPPCGPCGGLGKIATYAFNPMSVPQMKYLLYEAIGVPKSYQKQKVQMDEAALKKVLLWCGSGK